MTKFKTILFILCIGLFPLLSKAQAVSLADSVLQIVQQEKKYDRQVELLQEIIKKYYNTQLDETMILARFGYKLAN